MISVFLFHSSCLVANQKIPSFHTHTRSEVPQNAKKVVCWWCDTFFNISLLISTLNRYYHG